MATEIRQTITHREFTISDCKDCPCQFFDLEKYWLDNRLCGLQTDKEQEQAGGEPILCPDEGVAKECPLRQHHILLKVKNA